MSTELNRRELFSWARMGLGSVALTSILARDGLFARAPITSEADDPPPHFPAKAKRVINIVLDGGLSQVDSFDYKPELDKQHGTSLGKLEGVQVFNGEVGLLRKSDFTFRQRGESGLWISDLFPILGEVADQLTVIRSMVSDTPSHTPAAFQENTGFTFNGFPTMGAWLSYGLGNESNDLPTYVVIPDARRLPAGGALNWSNGFLPTQHQGVLIHTTGTPVEDLEPARPISSDTEQACRDYLTKLNRRHLHAHADSDPLAARIHSYELAARMQLAVPAVTDLSQETTLMHKLYGLDRPETADFGRSCILARRLLERGVRFVQLYSGAAVTVPGTNWDGHGDNRSDHSREALRIDRPLAGLIRDLRQRGMLEDSLVLFTTEFGRTPFTQSAGNVLGKGRDHNPYGFSIWMAGAGLKHGFAYGMTDDLGVKAVENPMPWYDFHATVLHLLGIDHERLTFYHNGIRRRLTNVHGSVVEDILS
jgi:hypothetical protein